MARAPDLFDLGRLALTSGEARRLDLGVEVERISLAGQEYVSEPVEVRLDVSRTMGGYSLRLRAEVPLAGPCMRCLEGAGRTIPVDAREIDQPGEDEELRSPYLEGDELRLGDWVRDAVVLALPAQIVCRDDCRGLCGICGEDLNRHPDHAHEAAPDPRWAKLDELRLP